MSNKKQTALQQAILELKKQKNTLKNHFEEGKWNNDRCEEIDNCVSILESKLELEKQQIIDARQDGIQVGLSVGYTERIPTNEYYYKETYEQ